MKPYTIIWKDSSFSLYFSGHVSLDDLIAANNEIIANPRVDSITHYYFDFCNVHTLELSEKDMQIYTMYDAVMPKFLKRSMIRGAFRVPSSKMKEFWMRFLDAGHKAWPRKAFISSMIAETWVQDGCAYQKKAHQQSTLIQHAIA